MEENNAVLRDAPVENDTGWSLLETPGSFDPIEDLWAFLAALPAMNLPDRQDAEVRAEVEAALAFRLANPLPGDPSYDVDRDNEPLPSGAGLG